MADNLHTPTILPSGKESPVSIKYAALWTWSCSGRFRAETNLVFLPAVQPRFLCYPARCLVTVPSTRFLL
jgi:hypothetical protein